MLKFASKLNEEGGILEIVRPLAGSRLRLATDSMEAGLLMERGVKCDALVKIAEHHLDLLDRASSGDMSAARELNELTASSYNPDAMRTVFSRNDAVEKEKERLHTDFVSNKFTIFFRPEDGRRLTLVADLSNTLEPHECIIYSKIGPSFKNISDQMVVIYRDPSHFVDDIRVLHAVSPSLAFLSAFGSCPKDAIVLSTKLDEVGKSAAWYASNSDYDGTKTI